MTNKQFVLEKFPKAKCLRVPEKYVEGKYYIICPTGIVQEPLDWDIYDTATRSPRTAWTFAAFLIRKGKL